MATREAWWGFERSPAIPAGTGQCAGIITPPLDAWARTGTGAMRCLWPALPDYPFCGSTRCRDSVTLGPPVPACVCGDPGVEMIDRQGRGDWTAHCADCAEAYTAWIYDEED